MTDVAAVAGSDVPEAHGLSQIERVVDAYVAPSKTFADIRLNASWWLPFLLVVIFFCAFNSISAKQVGTDRLAEMRMKASSSFESLPADQQAQRIAMTSKYWVAFGDGFGIPALLLIGLIAGGVLLGLVNFGMGGQGTYWQYVAVWFYAGLPALISFLLIIVTLFVGNPENFNINNPAATNPGFYLSPDAPHWLSVLLMQFDLFTIWMIALLVLGVSIVGKVKRSTAAFAILGIWVAWIVIRTSVAAF